LSHLQKYLLFLLTGTLTGCLPVLEPVDSPSYGGITCEDTEDDVADNATFDVGRLTPPITICGELASVGNDGDKYTGDRDNTGFRVTTSGQHRFSLEWDAKGDYDLYLYDDEQEGDTGGERAILPLEFASSGTYPEQFTAALQPGRDYVLVVIGWDGTASRWGVTIQPGS